MIGLLLKESLAVEEILERLHVTKVELWEVKNAVSWQPKVWTAVSFEVEDSQAEEISQALSRAFKPQAWYINASTQTDVYVIFPNKVFKYRKGDQAHREEAKRFGRSIGVPESQLDWSE
jgi:hypothetical protein